MSGVLRQGYSVSGGLRQGDTSVSGGLRQGYLSVWCLEAGIPQYLEA